MITMSTVNDFSLFSDCNIRNDSHCRTQSATSIEVHFLSGGGGMVGGVSGMVGIVGVSAATGWNKRDN